MKRKRKHTRSSLNFQIFEITDFLREIDRALPNIAGQEHRAMVLQARNYLMAMSTPRFPRPGEIPPCLMGNEEMLMKTIETLRCCGIAPAGWPQPPGPEALLRQRHVFVPGWDGTDGTGVQKA